MPLGETITVINKSGKIVSSSKHLVNVFKEARSAYRERKAEIKAARDVEFEEKRVRRLMREATLDDTRSRGSRGSRTPQRSKSHYHKPTSERGDPDSRPVEPHYGRPRSLERRDDGPGEPRGELVRRHTDFPVHDQVGPYSPKMARSHSESYIDMDLAYGELPPPLPSRRYQNDGEIREQMSKLTMLLDEANCLQYSATAMIEVLQKNPDALAAVALTLAEISNLATKLAPGILASLKGSFPAVIALLSSPQFMIAAGVGVGVTIVALGGYKIIKKITAQPEKEVEAPLELDELRSEELSRIEMWRRGIADAEAESMGTTVDGEFITPGASRHLILEGVLDAEDMKSRASRRERKTKSKAPKSTTSRKTTKSSKSTKPKSGSKDKDKEKKQKESSGIKLFFRTKG